MNDGAAVGSREYWRNPASYPDDWEARSVHAARFVSPGMRVLDIGCGPRMGLRKHLPAGCVYIPADLVPWTPEVEKVDIDADLFPLGEFGCVMLLGVIEYIRNPRLVFRYARAHARALVLSYCHPKPSADSVSRERMGWINTFSRDALASLATEENWRIAREEIFRDAPQTCQVIYCMLPESVVV